MLGEIIEAARFLEDPRHDGAAAEAWLWRLGVQDCGWQRIAGERGHTDVVVARFASRPGLLVVKRAVRPADPADPGGPWEVRGDNPAVQDDSRRYGPAEVLGTVVLRWWPLRDVGPVPSA